VGEAEKGWLYIGRPRALAPLPPPRHKHPYWAACAKLAHGHVVASAAACPAGYKHAWFILESTYASTPPARSSSLRLACAARSASGLPAIDLLNSAVAVEVHASNMETSTSNGCRMWTIARHSP
jgi:hypothetical protein